MKPISDNGLKKSKTLKKKPKNFKSILENKAAYLGTCTGKKRKRRLKKYYKQSGLSFKRKAKKFMKWFASINLPLYFSFARWVIIDFLRGKLKRKFGIFQFVALPGEGKTMAMVAHMERYRKEYEAKGKPCFIASNFSYKYNNAFIEHWTQMVEISKDCYLKNIPCLIAIDEIHVTWDSTDWQNFPAAVLAMLSFNRKFGLEFLCSSQIYERIPKKIRDIANYTVICKNIGHFDRLFRCYYFRKSDYESQFEGKKAKANYIKEFIADDDFYALYDTLELIDIMTAQAKEEKKAKEKAFDILFGAAMTAPEPT